MASTTHPAKSTLKHCRWGAMMLFIFFSSSSCRVIQETSIQDLSDANSTWINKHDSVYILCSTHYLKYFDTIYRSRPSPFKSDVFFAKTLVSEALSELYVADSSLLKKFVLCTEPNQIRSQKYIDLQVHVFVNWWALIPLSKVRESVCIKTSSITNRSTLTSHEEWGYRRTLGEFYDLEIGEYGECEVNNYKLKLYCVKKSLLEVFKSF